MSKKSRKIAADVPQKEAEERRDAILKRMLRTPPKPKKGKGKEPGKSARK